MSGPEDTDGTSAAAPEPERPTHGAEAADRAGLSPDTGRVVTRLWKFLVGTWIGLLGLALVIYVAPYGLGSVALSFQVARGGEFAAVGFAALITTAYASSVPIPTPILGTLSLALAAVLGANFDPVSAGLAGGLAQAVGLIASYLAGLAGLAPAITARLSKNQTAAAAMERARQIVRRRGAPAQFLLSMVPNPLIAYTSVFSGAVPIPWTRFVAVVVTGSLVKYLVVAFLGAQILD